MKNVIHLIMCGLMVCISLPALAQKITPVYTGTLKCDRLDQADSVKEDFTKLLDKVYYLTFKNTLKNYFPPDNKEIEFASDSITFNASKKARYSLRFNNDQNFVVEEYLYLLKVYQLKLPDATIYWKTKDLEYAKRFADDMVYFKNMPNMANQSEDFDAIAAKYRSLATKPAISEEARKYIVQANAMTQTKDYKKAIEYYNKAIRVEPANPMAYNNQALLYAMVGRYNDAINCMKKYLKLVPDAEDSRAVQDKIYEYEAMITK